MHNVEWRPELRIGVDKIDNDHKYLIELTNKLIQAIDNERSTTEMLKIFDELEAYTRYHFEREEGFMDENCSSNEFKTQIQKHKEQHRYFVDKLPLLKEKLLLATSKSVSYEIVEFLLEWLLDHIINEDLKLTQCLKGKEENKLSWIQRIGDTLRKKTSLHQRLWIILALPLFFFVLQTLFISYNGYTRYDQLQKVEQITQTVININNVITQLQKERGLSIAYISSDYRYFQKELEEQYRKTDTIVKSTKHSHDALLPFVNMDEAISMLKKLKKTRSNLLNHTLTRNEILNYYNQFVYILINIIKQTSYLPLNSIDRNTYSSILLLLHINEVNGLIRKEGITCISSHKNSCQRFQDLYKKKQTYLSAFNLLASPDLKQAVKKIEDSKSSQQIKDLQKRLINGELHSNQAAKKWFTLMTKTIDVSNKVIEYNLQKISHEAQLQKQHFRKLISIIWFIFLIIIIFIGISIYLFKESILRPLNTLTNALHKLTSGNKSIYFNTIQQKDAIGKMEQAYNHLRRSLIKSDYATILMELQELKTEKYVKLSEEDPLTGISNRRAFMHALHYEIGQAKKQHSPLSLLVLDIDHFKQINDIYGHDKGDTLLQYFVQETKQLIRQSDIFARIGGEEFALLLPNTTIDGACTLAQKIIDQIVSLNLDIISPELKMTVSIGIALYREEFTSQDFINEADKQLYKAKHAGRNRFSC